MGLEIDDVVGKNVFDYTPTESVPKRKAAIEKVFRTSEPLQLEDKGLTGVFEGYVHPVFNSAGEVTAVAVYARDITKRKQMEEKLQERMNELETFYHTTLGREERVIELKQEVNQLLEQLGKNKKYRDYS